MTQQLIGRSEIRGRILHAWWECHSSHVTTPEARIKWDPWSQNSWKRSSTSKTSHVFPSTAPICGLSQKWLVFLFVRRPLLTGPAFLNWRISSRRDHPLNCDCQPILKTYRPPDGNFLTSWLNIPILQWDIFEPKSIIWNSSPRAPCENDCLLRAKPGPAFIFYLPLL